MPQLPSYGRRYLQRGWSTQISWLHSTRGAFLREQKTWNGEVKHELHAQINMYPQVVRYTWISRAGVQPLVSPFNHPLSGWFCSMRSCGKLSRPGGVQQRAGARGAADAQQPLTALSLPALNLALTVTEQPALLSSSSALWVISFYFVDKSKFSTLSALQNQHGEQIPLRASQTHSTALVASSFFWGMADADKQIPAGRKIKSWCLIWGLIFTFSFERSPLNQHKRPSKAAHTPLL